jgi:hypothetical protein
MNKRDFLSASALMSVGTLPSVPAMAATAQSGPALLTVGGLVPKGNRAALDPELDQMMSKHGVKFSKAFVFDAAALQKLPKVNIRPTLEYNGKEHTLSGPTLLSVLSAAGVKPDPTLRLGMRAVDGYNVMISVADATAYRMILATHIDGRPMGLGSLGPQWAVYDADRLAAFKDKPLKERFGLCPWGVYYIDVAQG